MLGLRLALGAIALTALLTASVGGLAIVDFDGRQPEVTVELLLGGVGPYWDALAEGAEAAAVDRGVKLIVRNAGAGAHGQARLTILGDHRSATCSGEPNSSAHTLHVGVANYASGRVCGQYAAQTLANGSEVLLLVDPSAGNASAHRVQGFNDTLRYYQSVGRPLFQVRTESISAADDVPAADERGSDLTAVARRSSRADLVIDFTGRPAKELSDAFGGGSPGNRPRLVTLDQSEAALAAIETGELAAVLAHNPRQCGFMAVDRLVSFQRGGELEQPAAGKGVIYIPAQLVQRGTLAEFRSSMKTGTTSQL
jgi:ABC-type sugar transport system substrate-binding protein